MYAGTDSYRSLAVYSIDADVVATYMQAPLHLAVRGIVGMASLDMRDGLMKLLKKESITRGIEVADRKQRDLPRHFT